jgi:hypothetical protein
MKHCQYFIEIDGDESVANVVRKYVKRTQSSLSDSRELSRAITAIFGTSIRCRISVLRLESSRVNKYALSPDGKHA